MTTQQRIKVTLGHLHTRLQEVQHEHRQLTLAADALASLGRLDALVRGGRAAGKGESIRRRAPKRTRTMTPAQKKEVSVRMKRYWAKRRGELASKKK